MSYGLLAPSALWYLLAVPLLVLLYIMRLRRKRLSVSSVVLIEELVRDERVNTLFQRLHRHLLLLLQALFLALLALALARPFLAVPSSAPSDLVLVVDSSASMGASDQGPTRLDEAREAALAVIGRMGSQDRVAVVEAASSPRVLCEPTSDGARAAAAVASIRQTDGPGALADAVVLGLSLQQDPTRQRTIFLASDGASTAGSSFDALPPLEGNATRLVHVVVGSALPNLAITAFDARREPLDPYLVQAFLQVRNLGPEEREAEVEVLLDDEPLARRSVRVAAGGSSSVLVSEQLSDTGEHVVAARLRGSDALPCDDSAAVVLPAEDAVRVLHVADREGFVERALATDARIAVRWAPPSGLGGLDLSAFDVVLFDGVPLDLPPGTDARGLGVGCLGCTAPSRPELVPAELAGAASQAEVVDCAESHPLVRFTDLFDLRFLRLVAAAERPGTEVLVRSRTGVLAAVDERNLTRTLFFAASSDPSASDFPFRVSFPIFWTRAVRWLGERGSRARSGLYLGAEGVRTGEPVRVGGLSGPAAVETPSGEVLRLEPSAGEATFSATDRAGIYTVQASGGSARFAANLLSAAESNLTLQRVPRSSALMPEGVGASVERPRELWMPLALLALGLLLAEWGVYHLRGV